MPPFLSVIVPALNEEALLAATLDRLAGEPDTEIILVDGGSSDRTMEIAAGYDLTVLQSEPGRARQMNAGADRAQGEALLFCHADTLVPRGYKDLIAATLSQPGTVAGAFSLSISLDGRLIRLVEYLANRRARKRQLPFGDQGLFLAADRFRALDGYLDIALLEDVVLVERLRRQGTIAIINQCAVSSGRRWGKNGVLTTSLLNRFILLGYRLGVAPARLAEIYRQLGR